MKQVPEAAIELIKSFEGCELAAYRCPAGVWTCGYGATGSDIRADTHFTQSQAEARLAKDIETAAKAVANLVRVPLTANQLGALASFVFNLGAGNFRSSTMRRLVNQGQYEKAAQEFDRWIFASGRKLDGLVRRRAAEKALFLKAVA